MATKRASRLIHRAVAAALLLLLSPLAPGGSGAYAWNPFAKAEPEPWDAAAWCARAKELGLDGRLPAFRPPILPPGGMAAGREPLDEALHLLLDPYEDWLLVRTTPGVETDLRLLVRGTVAVLVARGESGLLFTPRFAAGAAATELTRRLKIPTHPRALQGGARLSPADLLLLRSLFEARLETERLLPEIAPADAPGLALTEMAEFLLSPGTSERIAAQPPRVRAALAALCAERFSAGRALLSLAERGLVRHRILAGCDRFALSPAGDRLAGCLFAPRDALRLARHAPEDARLPLEAVGYASSGDAALLYTLPPDGGIEILPDDPADPAAAVERLLRLLRELVFAGAAG